MKALILLALTPFAAVAGSDLKPMPNQELCVLMGMTLISPQSAYPITNQELVAELQSRGEMCAPADMYMAAATERVRRLDAIEAGAKQDAALAAQQADIDRRDRASRIQRALQGLSDQLNRPNTYPAQQRTSCRPDGIGGVNCTTW